MRNFLFAFLTEIEISTSRALVSDSTNGLHVARCAGNSAVDKAGKNLSSRFFTFKDLLLEDGKHSVDSFIDHLGDDLVEKAFHFYPILSFVV